jgi:hypothetical protein
MDDQLPQQKLTGKSEEIGTTRHCHPLLTKEKASVTKSIRQLWYIAKCGLTPVKRQCAVKNIVTFRFVIAAILVSAGCYALLARWPDPAIFFGFLPIVTMSRSEMAKPIPSRELLIIIGIALAFVVVVIASKWLVPRSVDADIQSVMRHPAFVLPLWIFLLWILYRVYCKQKAEADA